MPTVKEDLMALAQELPENATFADAQYRMYVLEQVRLGEQSALDEGEIPHEDLVRSLQETEV